MNEHFKVIHKTNVYLKLATVEIPRWTNNISIEIDYVSHSAKLIPEGAIITDIFINTEDSDVKTINQLIEKMWVYQGFNLLSTIRMDLKLFIGLRDFIYDKLKCDQETIKPNKTAEIPNNDFNSNDLWTNIEYFNSLLGYNYQDDCGPKYLKNVRYHLNKLRRERLAELHRLEKVNKYPISDDKINYATTMGLLYMAGIEIDDKMMIPETLGKISNPYTKAKITVLNTELCFINRNLKIVNQLLAKKKAITFVADK